MRQARHGRVNGHARILVALAGLSAACGLAQAQVDPQIIREGEGARRTALNATELKPFDFGTFALLRDWKHGSAPSAGSVAGRPILILTWTDFIPQSRRALTFARRLAEQHAKDGLIVVAAHAAQGWDSVDKGAAVGDGAFLMAHDADGAFRAALRQDADPDFYVIDRAGQMRYADIATESVEAALAIVLGETREQSAGVTDRLKAEAAAREAELRRTEALRERVDLTALPELPFPEPTPDDYKRAKWPDPPKDPNRQQTQGTNEPEPDLPRVAFADQAFFPAKPEMKGRITLLYFWHPDSRFTFQGVERFDLLQRQRGRDLNVVGCLSPLKDNTGQNLTIEADPVKLRSRLESFQRARVQGHSIYIDADGSIFETAQRHYQQSQGLPIPWIAIISSDGTMRWWGWLGDPKGQAAFDRVFEVDPGVKARRAAEAEFIRAREGR
jgi:hypothetical protein